MPKLGMPEIRKPQLIDATLEVIGEVGLGKTTVAMISKRAGVSAGIINHYFGGKDGLLNQSMRTILRELNDGVRERREALPADWPIERVRAIVGGNFDSRQLDPRVMKTWLAFWAQAMHDEELARLQRVNEKRLLSHLRYELRKCLSREQAREVAAGIAALIDGIWLRGALSGGVEQAEAVKLIDSFIRGQLGLLHSTSRVQIASNY
ncbi:transcriptional regulator BetI [Pokkaliibacter plantistimulans]|uniref:HTH-type transcriptional regulator BetI n=1 Tax=Proteobacteria bacterium 228 TaxID=2083153 RepID=A0A2S5KQU9_9PROT|nr:transcriptional regulator BetI [Pokkaliibacter plantistimulans]PPC77073.1 transcriptional regulator BetI [Pokkaliibacter plantistimulans]